MPASALIIDDHPLYRDALTQLLGAMLGESSVKSASCGEEALKFASSMPDLRLVLMDFNLPGISGTEAIEAVLSRFRVRGCRRRLGFRKIGSTPPLRFVPARSSSSPRRSIRT